MRMASIAPGARAVAMALLTAAVVVMLICLPVQRAWAYYALAPVSIGLSSSSVSLEKGQSATVSCSVSPESERQLPGCGMAECPQVCDGLATPDGVVGGCQNDEGWCTCSGLTYVTYSTAVTVVSSAPNVARARYERGVLVVKAYGAGTATIQVKAALAKHVDAAKSLTVTVTEPPAPQPASQEGQPTSPDGGSGSQQPSDSGSSGSPSAGGGDAQAPADASGTSAATTGSNDSPQSDASKAGGSSAGVEVAVVDSGSQAQSGSSGASGATGVRVRAVGATNASSGAKSADGHPGEPEPETESAQADAPDATAAGGQEPAGDAGQEPAADALGADAPGAEGEQGAPVDASMAAASISTAQEAPSRAPAGGAAALVSAVAVAGVAGAWRYRSWKLQRGPMVEE